MPSEGKYENGSFSSGKEIIQTIWGIQLQGFGAVQYALFEVTQFDMTGGEVVEAGYPILPLTINELWFVKAYLLKEEFAMYIHGRHRNSEQRKVKFLIIPWLILRLQAN